MFMLNSVIPSASEGPREYRMERRWSFDDQRPDARSFAALRMTADVSGRENFSRHA